MKITSFSGRYIDERMYVLADGDQVILIDAAQSEAANEYLARIRPREVRIILTHEHIDHIYGVNQLREQFPCQVLCSKKCGLAIGDSKLNLARYREVVLGKYADCSDLDINYCCMADMTFEGSYMFEWQGHSLCLRETPGHSAGSIGILYDNNTIFTGDTLLKNDPIITRLPGGSRDEYRKYTLPWLRSLSPEIRVYPGHGEPGRLKDCVMEGAE